MEFSCKSRKGIKNSSDKQEKRQEALLGPQMQEQKHQEVVAVSFFSKAAQRKGCFWPRFLSLAEPV